MSISPVFFSTVPLMSRLSILMLILMLMLMLMLQMYLKHNNTHWVKNCFTNCGWVIFGTGHKNAFELPRSESDEYSDICFFYNHTVAWCMEMREVLGKKVHLSKTNNDNHREGLLVFIPLWYKKKLRKFSTHIINKLSCFFSSAKIILFVKNKHLQKMKVQCSFTWHIL